MISMISKSKLTQVMRVGSILLISMPVVMFAYLTVIASSAGISVKTLLESDLLLTLNFISSCVVAFTGYIVHLQINRVESEIENEMVLSNFVFLFISQLITLNVFSTAYLFYLIMLFMKKRNINIGDLISTIKLKNAGGSVGILLFNVFIVFITIRLNWMI